MESPVRLEDGEGRLDRAKLWLVAWGIPFSDAADAETANNRSQRQNQEVADMWKLEQLSSGTRFSKWKEDLKKKAPLVRNEIKNVAIMGSV